jgi:hypothetical protein
MCNQAILSQFTRKKRSADAGDDESDCDLADLEEADDEADTEAQGDVDPDREMHNQEILDSLDGDIEEEFHLTAAEANLGQFAVTKVSFFMSLINSPMTRICSCWFAVTQPQQTCLSQRPLAWRP